MIFGGSMPDVLAEEPCAMIGPLKGVDGGELFRLKTANKHQMRRKQRILMIPNLN